MTSDVYILELADQAILWHVGRSSALVSSLVIKIWEKKKFISCGELRKHKDVTCNKLVVDPKRELSLGLCGIECWFKETDLHEVFAENN